MNITEKILDGIKKAITEGGPVTVNLKEASALTGSGDTKGGRTNFEPAFAAMRFANPFRLGATVEAISGSSAMYVAKTGNASDPTNPWGYTPANNTGSPNVDTVLWQIPTRVVSARLPIRSAVLTDVNNLQATLVDDLMMELATLEGASAGLNNDQAGSVTLTTGGTDGLRGLNSYPGAAGAAAAYGTSGSAITNGLHTLATIGASVPTLGRDTLVDMRAALPPQYWALPGTAWMMHPTAITALSKAIKASNTGYDFVETGDDDGGVLSYALGFPVIPNPHLDAWGVGGKSIYLANWPQFMVISDVEEITVQMMDQTAPGFTTLYAEKRVITTVRNPFAGVRVIGT